MKDFLKKYKVDIILIGILLIISLIISLCFYFISFSDQNIASIYVSSTLINQIDLNKEQEEARYIIVNGKHGEVKVEVKLNSLRIIQSSCINKSCIHQGELTSLKPLICAYNEVYIELNSFKDVDVELG